MKLNSKTQEKLHEALGDTLLGWFKRPPCDHCGFSGLGAKELTVVRQWLADNSTTADVGTSVPLRQLADALPEFDPEDRVAKPGKKRTA